MKIVSASKCLLGFYTFTFILLFNLLHLEVAYSAGFYFSDKVSNTDYLKLKELEKETTKRYSDSPLRSTIPIQPALHHFMLLVDKSKFEEAKKEVKKSLGLIVKSDSKMGYLHLQISASLALKLLEWSEVKALVLDKKVVPDNELPPDPIPFSEDSAPLSEGVFPTKLMEADPLKKQFEDEFNTPLNGSEVKIAVFDSGLDMSRTDMFQGRIAGLRSLRKTDRTLLKKAEITKIGNKEYLTVTVNKRKVMLLKTPRLQEERDYFLGFFSEKQFQSRVKNYNRYDFNQDGKATGIFPIVVFKNSEGKFQAFINVNDKATYPQKGDQSIEDEIPLFGFNEIAQTSPNRYVSKTDTQRGYYKFTTSMDILKEEQLLPDRNGRLVNLAITLEKGFELNETGEELRVVAKENNQEIYQVGLVGFDLLGHGTHCAGIAAGHFDSVPKFSSAADQAKVYGITILGPQGASQSDVIDMVLHLTKDKGVSIFNFSFGFHNQKNDSQHPTALILDKMIRTYNIAIVKSAGNSGPGINSHGMPLSEHMISVANYFNSDARMHHIPNETLIPNKNFISANSSRGPMIDGLLKPDIGAPGWVLSGVPFAAPLSNKSTQHSFQYWSGTSMAVPNVVSIITLLYDGILKAGFPKTNTESAAPVRIDQVIKSITNTALPYDNYTSYNCMAEDPSNMDTLCDYNEHSHKFDWLDGGAGRISALGSWQALQENLLQEPLFIKLESPSTHSAYNGNGLGYFDLNQIDDQITFTLSLNELLDQTENPGRHESLLLKIFETPWLSFSPDEQQSEKTVELFANEKTSVTLFIDKEQLMEQNSIHPGRHLGLLKIYNLKHPAMFDRVIPFVIIGNDTELDGTADDYRFISSGFIPAALTQSYFFPVEKPGDTVVVNLSVSSRSPGTLRMAAFHHGFKVPFKMLGEKRDWITSDLDNPNGINQIQYTFGSAPSGSYEITLAASPYKPVFYEGLPGSHYELLATRYSLQTESISSRKDAKNTYILLKQAVNKATSARITSSTVVLPAFQKVQTLKVSHKQLTSIPFKMEGRFGKVEIKTAYYGTKKDLDVDIILLDVRRKVVKKVSTPSALEKLTMQLKPGPYTIQIEGFNIPGQREDIELSITQNLKNPIQVGSVFRSKPDNVMIKKGFLWKTHRSFPLLSLPISHIRLNAIKSPATYNKVIKAQIRARHRFSEKDILIWQSPLYVLPK